LGEAVIFIARGEIEFPERQVPVSGGFSEDRVQTNEFGTRFSRELGSLLQGSVQISYTSVSRNDVDANDFSGLTYGATLRIRPQGRLRAEVLAERAVRPTSRIGISYSVDETYKADLQYDLTPSTILAGGASLRRREFAVSGSDLLGETSQEDLVSAFASVQTNVRNRIALGLEVQWDRRNAEVALFDYTSIRFGISSKWLFD
jgi:hypothetical protein